MERIYQPLMNAGRLTGIDFVVIHNDAGRMRPAQYVAWLANREKALGIAHYYIDSQTIAQVIDTSNIGYHTGDWWSNCHSIGYEVTNSLGATDAQFLANEDVALMQATEDLLYYALPITTQTVRLHHEFVPTSCPHRSMALHGGTTASVKAYFVSRMQHFATLGSTVEEMLQNTPRHHTDHHNTPDTIAKQVIHGDWGNGQDRIDRLTQAGYDATDIQARVNRLLKVPAEIAAPDLTAIAYEVIRGDWGNGQARIDRLSQAGYDATTIQTIVNALLA